MDGTVHKRVLTIRLSNVELTGDLSRIRLQPMTRMAHFCQIDLIESELGVNRRIFTLPSCLCVPSAGTGTEATVQSGKADLLGVNPKFAVTARKRQIETTPVKRKRLAGMDLD